MSQILFETDWLASRPVFYNEKTGRASCNINNVIDYTNLQIDSEGFNNYLDFGYSVFGQTPVKNVKFLRHSSRLWADAQGNLTVESLPDPVDAFMERRYSETDIIDLLQSKVREWERSVDGEIVIPTSGGYDSRLLNWLITDKARIRSFTYGISEKQAESSEVVYARKLAEILGTKWEHIQLGDYHRYFDDWDLLFGPSTHAQGMYHIEFYEKIGELIAGGNPLLSGIIGDGWAGSVNIQPLEDHTHLTKLSYSHGVSADSAQSVFRGERKLLQHYWAIQGSRLRDPRFRIIESMRCKIILLTYLMAVPQSLNFKCWSPFLDIEIAMAMLNLPPARRNDRLWQKELFQKVGLDLNSMGLHAVQQNTLDLQALRRVPVQHLDANLLKEVINPNYVEWINKNAVAPSQSLINLLNVRKVGGALRRLGLNTDKKLKAYSSYLVLLPIEKLLRNRKRN